MVTVRACERGASGRRRGTATRVLKGVLQSEFLGVDGRRGRRVVLVVGDVEVVLGAGVFQNA
jgi:hypothetical protein